MNPTVSIITVCYNGASLLEKTVKSILKQKDSSLEYIIIDGASTDETQKILELYRDEIDIIVSEPDDGIFDAMNKGIAHASGRYLLFVNAGDTLFDDSLKYIESQLATNLDVYYFGYYNIVTVRGNELIFEGPKCFSISHEIPTCHNAMVISKEAFKAYGSYDTAYNLCADYEWLCRNYDHLKTRHCEEKVIYSLLGGVSEVKNLAVLRQKATIAKRYFGWVPFLRHIFRFIRIYPIAILKRFFIKIGVFENYLLLKYALKR